MNTPSDMFARAWLPMLLAASVASCASHPSQDDSAKLVMYRSHAGAPVRSFHFFGRLDSWTPLGDRAVAVWTRPSEAWLLDLDGSCNGLEYTVAIGLTSSAGTVNARFDKVLVHDGSPMNLPCIIQSIRPLDVAAIKAAEHGERAASDQASGT